MLYGCGSQPLVHGTPVVCGLMLGVQGAKAISLFYVICRSARIAQFSVVVRDRKTKFISGPRITKG